MTIQGAIIELQNLFGADDIPFYYKPAIEKVIETIVDELPSADAVEVVRCKDCRYRYYADNRVPHERTWVCERFSNEETTDNDFCSFGERSEE